METPPMDAILINLEPLPADQHPNSWLEMGFQNLMLLLSFQLEGQNIILMIKNPYYLS